MYVDPDTKRVFTSAPFIFFRTDRNLKSFLVRSKVYPLERKVGSAKCNGKRCQMCLSVNETDVSKSFQTEQKYKINHHYNDWCLIYFLFYNVYGRQYVGSTIDKFRFRWNNYKENDTKVLRGEDYTQPGLFHYFTITIIISSWMTVALNWLIKKMTQIPREEKSIGGKFWKLQLLKG